MVRLQQQQEQQLAATRQEAQNRKQRMLDKELEVRARREQSAMEREIEAEKKAPLTGEEVLRNQHLTSLRKIQSLELQASGYMLCDSLKQHRKQREETDTRYNKVHDSIMERDCITELQRRREMEDDARAKRVEARQMLEHQIAEREKKKIWEEEAKAIEAQKILATYKKFEAEEQAKVVHQREQRQVMMTRIAETNKCIKQIKDDAVQREKQEEMVAAAYLRKKAMEEEAKLQDAQRVRKAQEIRTAKLRAQQEKAQDKQAIQDEFRAKKAWEENERKARYKEKRDKEIKRELMQTILGEREQQMQFQQQQQRAMAQVDAQMDQVAEKRVNEEYLRQQAIQQAHRESEHKHGDVLLQQIESNAQRRQMAKLFEQNDAKFLKKKNLRESVLAEKVRQDTLHRLQKQGVPEEYLRELSRMTINASNA